MPRYMRFLAALFALASVRCASAEPCSPGNEDPDEWGPTTLPAPGPGGPTDPGTDPGESDGDAFGYRRKADGDVCACDWLEHEEGGCSQNPHEVCGNGMPRDVNTGECAEPAQYHKGKSDPPPSDPPPSEHWHCYCVSKCDYGNEQPSLSTNGFGELEYQAKNDCAQRWAIKADEIGCANYNQKPTELTYNCGRL